jgi:HlyD family secretion protein
VEITAEAFMNQRFRGTVIQIAPMGETVQNVTVFQVRIQLRPRATAMLKPGMNATARIVYLSKNNILAVPVSAISRRGDKFGVMKFDKSEQQIFTEIKTGVRDEGNIEITDDSPLQEGDIIFVPDKAPEKDGQRRGMGMGMGRMMPRAR